jgi:predicted TIM-barrel fold metal-dependent hydrolase
MNIKEELQTYRIFDSHMHIDGLFLHPYKDILEYMDEYNVKKAMVTTINRAKYYKKEEQKDKEKTKVTKTFERFKELMPKTQLSHKDVEKISKKAPDRIYKFFWFNPNVGDDEIEESFQILEEKLVNENFKGVKVHSGFNLVKIPKDVERLAHFMQNINENLILFIHSTPKVLYFKGISSRDIAKLARKFPNLKIVLLHGGFTMEFAVEVGMTLKKYKNVYFETSCSISLAIYNLIKSVGHKRILYGSDSPTASTLPIELEKILTLPKVSHEIKQDILYNNFLELLSE